jgi:hypothetical protein
MKLTRTILEEMTNVGKWQKEFFDMLIQTMLSIPNQVNFSSLSRYSGVLEKRFRRWFKKAFDFCTFNSKSISQVIKPGNELVAALDQSFIDKSGKATWGRATFWNGCESKAEKGLEVSLFALIDIATNTAFSLFAEQTPPDDEIQSQMKSSNIPNPSRIDFYLSLFGKIRDMVLKYTLYFVFDGYFTKKKFIDGVVEMGFYVIGKLRRDADLKILYNGAQKKGRGRPRKFVGKCNVNELEGFDFDQEVDDNTKLYSGVFWHVSLERNIKVVAVVKEENGKHGIALLFSTDLELETLKVYQYYKARYQIEFIFRDANQHTGLGACQSRNKESLHFHFNASFVALNLVKIQELCEADFNEKNHAFSMASHKARYYNENLIGRFFPMLGFDLTSIKSMPIYQEMINYGAICSRRV